ncbi:hypothetical protein V8E54_000290 [Elaphomyces granulatus]
MSIFYSGEDTFRASIGRTLINKIFAARRDGFRPTITAASIGPVQCSTTQSRQQSVRTDGHFTGDHGVLIVIGEFQPEILDSRNKQVLASHLIVSKSAIYGVADAPQKISDSEDIYLPYVSSLSKWPNRSNDPLKFRIKIEYPFNDSKHGRLLYIAETSDGQTIVVKFVRQYCPELYDICAVSDHAPSLLAYQRLPGGWYGVGMEYVASAIPITLHKEISVHFQRWETDLRQLVSQFHGLGFVHGDLRDANIISSDDGCVKLVDFDWAGKDGQVSYPMLALYLTAT